jgi:heavy metal sensor kinase
MRLTLWYLAIFALAQIVFGAGMWFILKQHLFDLVDDGLEEQVDDLRAFLQTLGPDPEVVRLKQGVNDTYAIEHLGNYLALYDQSGGVIYCSSFLQTHQTFIPVPDRVDRPRFANRRFEHRAFRFLKEQLSVNGHLYTVEMGAPSSDVMETLATFRTYLLMFAPLLLLAAAGGGYWLSRRALSPVDALVRTARDIGGADLSSRLQKLDTGDELQRLADTLNDMLARIEAAFSRVTEFTADASHELRTPVSLIRTEAELALRRSRDEAEYKEALRHILLEAERTSALIEQLLSLARADSGRETLHLQPVNLTPVLRDVAQSWGQVGAIRDLKFSASFNVNETFVLGDPAALHRLAEILLDNAFKYTPPPGSVGLTLNCDGDNAVIIVQDSGVGIATEEHQKIFERFYRVDQARSRAQGGAGLGLAIAHWIVAQHRGSITVESSPGAGATFRVKLPLIPAPVPSPQPA